VILNTGGCTQKITSQLEDMAYRKLLKDPIESVERRTTNPIKKFPLPEKLSRQLLPNGSRTPKFYEKHK
jgi:hypothetical protein